MGEKHLKNMDSNFSNPYLETLKSKIILNFSTFSKVLSTEFSSTNSRKLDFSLAVDQEAL